MNRTQEPLRLFEEHLPYLPRCSNNKTAALIRPKAAAIKFDYVQVNQKTQVYWLIFDLDHNNPYVFEDKLLPTPNIICADPDTGRSHLFYAISPVCTSPKASLKPIGLMKAVYRKLATALNADLSYTQFIAKNPLSQRWITTPLHNQQYDLHELLEYCNGEALVAADSLPIEHMEGRNTTLFNALRKWAYQHVSKFKDTTFDIWYQEIEKLAIRLNHRIGVSVGPAPLPYSEVKATAKSVARWVFEKYRYTKKSTQSLLLDPTSTLAKRQSCAARFARQTRSNKIRQRVIEAYKALKRHSPKITITSIAKQAGISRSVIYKNSLLNVIVTQLLSTHQTQEKKLCFFCCKIR